MTPRMEKCRKGRESHDKETLKIKRKIEQDKQIQKVEEKTKKIF